MRIIFENVDFRSRTGPNGFGLKLARSLIELGADIVDTRPDVCLSFIQSSNAFNPTALRLDGIYFNSEQNWQDMNAPIQKSYNFSKSVIVQSNFDKDLIFSFFGEREDVHVVPNGTDLSLIEKIPAAKLTSSLPREKVWMCASSWRPHKRLKENIQLFKSLADEDSILLIAGENVEKFLDGEKDPRIILLGNLTWENLISCMKTSGHFVHLAWLDHCPNVVIDAKACGCKLHISDSGGTPEIVDKNDQIYEDAVFNFSPTSLYSPPKMSLYPSSRKSPEKIDISISTAGKRYYDVLRNLL